jgi:hypothetical protein
MSHLLSDADVAGFLIKGFHIVTPACSAAVHAAVTAQADAHDAARDGVVTGDADTPHDEVRRQQDLFATVPAFDEVVCDAAVQGALTSLLGAKSGLLIQGRVLGVLVVDPLAPSEWRTLLDPLHKIYI